MCWIPSSMWRNFKVDLMKRTLTHLQTIILRPSPRLLISVAPSTQERHNSFYLHSGGPGPPVMDNNQSQTGVIGLLRRRHADGYSRAAETLEKGKSSSLHKWTLKSSPGLISLPYPHTHTHIHLLLSQLQHSHFSLLLFNTCFTSCFI